jgi:hypothetical protein
LEAKETLEILNNINQSLKRMCDKVSLSIPKRYAKELDQPLMELMAEVREAKQFCMRLGDPRLVFLSGNVLGRLEMIYALVGKAIDESKK